MKREPRKGWVSKLGIKDPESVADHSYRTALMAMVYSDVHGLDTLRVLKMALIHDLPEAIVGDSIPGERTKERKLKLESTAMKEILEEMPPAQRREYGMIWQEFNSGESEEALLVREVDKLEMAVQASEYRSAHAALGTEEFIESARAAIRDPDLLALLRLVSQPG
ncbi:MAG: HD domain-containing protein [Thaumarchaeota archaeon]|nr:HD domain-containing protein [Nitrososphaerota archaeon]